MNPVRPTKVFKSAPLPFVGQKRRWVGDVERLLRAHVPNGGEGWTVVDPFAGSCLLSHTAKRVLPRARVVCNSLDGYDKTLEQVGTINEALRTFRAMIGACREVNGRKHAPLPKALRQQVVDYAQGLDLDLFAPFLAKWFLHTSSLCDAFSFDHFKKVILYNNLRRTDYPNAEGYLDGVEIVAEDFRPLMQRFQGVPNVLWLLDPPYIFTERGSYRRWFALSDYLQLLSLVDSSFLFFGSCKSELGEVLNTIVDRRLLNWRTFQGFQTLTRGHSVASGRAYLDHLYYRFC